MQDLLYVALTVAFAAGSLALVGLLARLARQ
jgi:hypothetical protein